jgi:carbon storage regulator
MESQMLVLSRQLNEGITINHNVHIVVVDVRGDKVRLGIDAPKDVAVNRDEVEKMNAAEEQVQPPITKRGPTRHSFKIQAGDDSWQRALECFRFVLPPQIAANLYFRISDNQNEITISYGETLRERELHDAADKLRGQE